MSYLYKFLCLILIIAAGYTVFGIAHFKWAAHSVKHPKADFLVSGNLSSDDTLIEFLNYGCGYCKEIHSVIKELKQVRKDLRIVLRPISLDDVEKDKITRIALAAGLQGQFEEMHNAFLEYPEIEIPDSFVEETAALYGLDYDQLLKDANGKEVEKILNDNFSAIEYAGVTSVPAFMFKDQTYIVTDGNLPDLKKMLTIISPTP